MAILPLNKKEFSLVWSVSKNYKLNIMEDLIKEKLKKTLGLDKKINLSKIDFFPISFKFNTNFFKKNILVLGEGSYNIHPIAGQGYNLILRDIKILRAEITKHLSCGMQLKDSGVLNNFAVKRKPENFLFGLGISLMSGFFKYNKIAQPIKNVILKDINKFKFLKNFSINLSNKGFSH